MQHNTPLQRKKKGVLRALLAQGRQRAREKSKGIIDASVRNKAMTGVGEKMGGFVRSGFSNFGSLLTSLKREGEKIEDRVLDVVEVGIDYTTR